MIIKSSLLVIFQLYKRKNKTLEEFSKKNDAEFIKVPLIFQSYIFSWKEVKKTFNEIQFPKESKALLDITTMPRNIIYCMLHFLGESKAVYQVVYYPAKKHTNRPTTNPLPPHTVLQHGGIMYPDKRTLLVVFVGYDQKRLYQLYNCFEPYETIVFAIDNHFTSPPEDYENYDEEFIEASNIKLMKVDSASENNAFDILSKVLTRNVLDKNNVLMCSLGPKIESIGVYKFHKMNPETALLYAPSKDYAKDYSTGIKVEEVKKVSSEWVKSITDN